MKRRAFVAALGSAAVAWPFKARAQAPPVIGFLGPQSAEQWASRVRAFKEGLAEIGFVDGRNVAIEYRWAENRAERLPDLVAELVRQRVKVIVTGGVAGPLAAKAATTTIPIVFVSAFNPVTAGLVASFNRPGGNVTGVTSSGEELGQKRLELLHDMTPTARAVTLLVNPANPIFSEAVIRDAQEAARALGFEPHVSYASAERDFEAVFAELASQQGGGLVIGSDGLLLSLEAKLAALALRAGVPAVFQNREFVAAGGLMSYGASSTDVYRSSGVYAGRILRGESPAALPVLQATQPKLFINMKTARTLGITVPLPLLGRANELID
jgi:putative ABC transport system substrate-binding protein